jgi:hypothetical protein
VASAVNTRERRPVRALRREGRLSLRGMTFGGGC